MADLNQQFLGARSDPERLLVTAIPDKIFHVFGVDQVNIDKPDNYRTLMVKVEVGGFRFRPGAETSDLTPPLATDQDVGSGSVLIVVTDGIMAISAPSQLTVQSVGASDILTYWWLK